MSPGVVMSSTLAAVPLLEDNRPALLARRGRHYADDGHRSRRRAVRVPLHHAARRRPHVTPQALLDEVYPLAAYYQDTWQEGIQAVRVAGLHGRLPEFVRPLQEEFRCDVGSLLNSAISEGRLPSDVRPLADRELEGLVGWMMHRN